MPVASWKTVVSSHSDSDARRQHDPGLLGELAVRRRLELLAVVDVAADEAPAVGVDRRVLVALLQQHPAARVHEQDAGESGHACHAIDMRLAGRVCFRLALLVPAAPATAQEPEGLSVTGWILQSGSNRLVERNADGISTLSVAAVMLGPGGDRVSAPTDDARRLLRTAHRNGLSAELLVSNYSNALEDFDPRAAHRLLDSDRHIAAVAERLARFARPGLGRHQRRPRTAPEGRRRADWSRSCGRSRTGCPRPRRSSIDVSATGSLPGYRDRGYRMAALAEAADTIKLMTYDQHGPTWSGPGPIGALGWQRRRSRRRCASYRPARLDLGVAGYGYTWPEQGTGRSLTVRTGAPAARPRRRARALDAPRTASGPRGCRTGPCCGGRTGGPTASGSSWPASTALHGLAVWRLGSADTLR